ncbi:CoA ester lyase [Streptomyces sp. Caat 7-52]|uniref:HpcH/HpaI aldolase/citrate lyase family protein n=1 Tax=Streptomyces sp. Caat 7-52 TaxID=2949637 RepID=UPI002034B86E|nr:CoA ester lyase [Streptomyces sp. Caat 7-52]
MPETRWQPGPAWLFCPADRPERYTKALAAADVVIVDLEDAVAPDRKAAARDALHGLVADGTFHRDRTVVRVNAADSPEHPADLALADELALDRLMLAKAEHPDAVAALRHEVIVLLETPRGVAHAVDLAAQANVIGVMWGADDLIAGLGGFASRREDGSYRDVAVHARSQSLIAAKAAGRLALDSVYMDIPDLDGLRAEADDAVACGFDAKVAIHPTQTTVIRAAYRPAPERLEWARRLLAHVGTERGVTTFEGRMVDGPIYAQAERIVRLTALTDDMEGGR